jgi:hypothetical protein
MGSNNPLNPYAPPKVPIDGQPEEVVDMNAAERPKPKWSTVAAFGNPARALEALRLLEDAQLECRGLEDGTVGSSIPLQVGSVPLGGHLVQVHTPHLARAATILGVAVDPDEGGSERPNPADERMKKALTAALLGALLCPGVAHLVSLLLIWATPTELLTPVGRQRRRWALVVDVVVFAAIAFLVATEPTSNNAADFRRSPPRVTDPLRR